MTTGGGFEDRTHRTQLAYEEAVVSLRMLLDIPKLLPPVLR